MGRSNITYNEQNTNTPCGKCGGLIRYRNGKGGCAACGRAHSKSRKEYNRKYSEEKRKDPAYREKIRTYRHSPEGRAKNLIAQTKRRETVRGRSKDLFENAKRRAKVSSLKFSITKDDIYNLLLRETEYMASIGLPFNYTLISKGRNNAMAPSVDQIIPGNGYTLDNIRIVPWCYNALKGDWFTDKQALEFCRQFGAANNIESRESQSESL